MTSVHTVTVVHHLDTVRIDLDAAVCIVHVGRIDRSHLLGESEDVTSRGLATVVTQRIVVETSVTHVCTHFQPLLGLIVSLQTSGETLHITLFGDTLVLQVTQRNIGIRLVCRSGNRNIVLLTVTCTDTNIFPIIGLNQIVTLNTADGSQRIQFTILTNQHLTLGIRPNIVADTTASLLTEQTCVGCLPCRIGIHTLVNIVIVDSIVMLLVVGCRIRNDVILLQSLCVPTILGVESNDSVTRLSLLGGNHHNTVGTTSTIQGI